MHLSPLAALALVASAETAAPPPAPAPDAPAAPAEAPAPDAPTTTSTAASTATSDAPAAEAAPTTVATTAATAAVTAPAPAEPEQRAPGGWSLFRPVPMDQRRPMVTDRPDLTESPVTVDAGHLQVEADVVVATWRPGGAQPLSLDLMPTNLKVGLLDTVDLQILIPALGVLVDADGRAAPAAGDVGVRLKWNLLGNDGEGVGVALMPWAFVGGADLRPGVGMIVPVSVPLPADFGLGTMAVLNYVPAEGGNYDAEVLASASVGHALWGDLAGYLEVLGAARPMAQAGELVASTGLTYLLGEDLQLDAGLRYPVLTDDARLETFLGISARH